MVKTFPESKTRPIVKKSLIALAVSAAAVASVALVVKLIRRKKAADSFTV